MLTIRRVDPARGMARFYSLTLQADLLGGWSLIREWGRIGQPGQVRVDQYADAELARAAALKLEASKRRRGYG